MLFSAFSQLKHQIDVSFEIRIPFRIILLMIVDTTCSFNKVNEEKMCKEKARCIYMCTYIYRAIFIFKKIQAYFFVKSKHEICYKAN